MRLFVAAFFLMGCRDGSDKDPAADDTGADTGDGVPGCPALGIGSDAVVVDGRIGAGVVSRLALSNTCEQGGPLTITGFSFTADSPYLQAVLPRTPYELASGEMRFAYVEYVARDYNVANGTLTIESDDPALPSVDVAVIGMVNPDADGDGAMATGAGGGDCDDWNPAVNPAVNEIWYNGIDENCDGADDYDADLDGYRRVEDGGQDCNDDNAQIHPAATEIWYDGVDSNCDGADDFDQDGDGVAVDEDCNDLDGSVTVGSDEIWYDGLDGDCDGWDDYDADYDGFSSADYGGLDCDDTDGGVSPAATEVYYDGFDQNCDGADDYDMDGDGARPVEWGGDDCDDDDPWASPGTAESADLADNDCDGLVDEDFVVEGDVLITELMVNPSAVGDSKGEYVELYNNALDTLDLVGWTLSDGDGNVISIDSELQIEPGEFVVLGPNGDSATNGGVDVDFTYGAGLVLDNGDEEMVILELDGATIASVAYDEGWPIDSGASLSLDPSVTDITATGSVDAWCASESALPSGDLGTPGAMNDLCPTFDHDGDGWTGEDGDCDDADPDVNPEAVEAWYDGVDQDCSGGSDYDGDGDGADSDAYGGADCDDADPGVGPDADEIWYDGFDQNCSSGSDFDADGDGWDAEIGGGEDCDDGSAEAYPGGTEVFYDGVDGDCAGDSDFDQDGDGDEHDGYGGGDCDDADPAVSSLAEERWDGLDGDCDGGGDDMVVDDATDLRLEGPAGAELGAPAGLSAGDLDGDGVTDLVVGSVSAGSGLGGAWLLSGAEAARWTGSVDDAALASFSGAVVGGGTGVLGEAQGDLSGDGVADLTVAGTDTSGGAAVYIWTGGSLSGEHGTGDAWATLYGATDTATRVASHLDLDGSGVADLAFGDLAYYSTDRGQVYVVMDDALGGGGAVSMSAAYDLRVRGTASDAHVGSALSGGDIDGDGYDDLIIGAYGTSSSAGALYVYSGGLALAGSVDVPSGATLTINGSSSAELGYSAPALGDVDGDGAVDLLMGAPGKKKAAVVLAVGGATGSLSFGSSDLVISGGDASGFGVSVALADVNGDGKDEALVGAPNTLTAGGGGSNPGELYLFWADVTGTLSATGAGGRLEGGASGDALGGAVLNLGDLDGDAREDLVFAAWNERSGGADAGAVYLMLMP